MALNHYPENALNYCAELLREQYSINSLGLGLPCEGGVFCTFEVRPTMTFLISSDTAVSVKTELLTY